jgi:hypothetical protein
MSHVGFDSRISWSPVLDAIRQPWRLLHGATRRIRDGRIYLGEGQPIVVFPVFGRGPESTARLRALLDQSGFRSYDWGQGVDKGPGGPGLNKRLRQLEEHVIDVFEIERNPVTLLGWGLSGIYAREVAKRTTPLVRQVITLSTPFNLAVPAPRPFPMLRALQDKQGCLDPAVAQRLRQRPPVPCTCVYSVSDRAVPWEMCLDTESVMSENISVAVANHSQLGNHPKVLEIITHRLAQSEAQGWRPFDA